MSDLGKSPRQGSVSAPDSSARRSAAYDKLRSISVRAEQSDHDALDDELLGRQQVRVARIFGAEEGTPTLDEEALQGRLAVDEGGDDILGARLAGREKDGVAFDDAGIDHRVAADTQGKDLAVGPDTKGGGIDGNKAIRLLLGIDREAGRDDTEDRYLDQRTLTRVRRGQESAGLAIEPTQRALGGERIDMALDAEGTRETEVCLDLAERRSHTMLTMVRIDEIEDLLLTICEGLAHLVFM